jgi:hypothetical protein
MILFFLASCNKIEVPEVDFENCSKTEGACDGQALGYAVATGYNAVVDYFEKKEPVKEFLIKFGERNSELRYKSWKY